MAERRFDAVVIGGGVGGYSCAIRLAQLGKRVMCIEKELVGGVCLNWGCIPSKILVSASGLYTRAKNASSMGLHFRDVDVNLDELQAFKARVVERLTGSVRTLLRANGAVLRIGSATLRSADAIEIVDADGSRETIFTDTVVIATGASLVELPMLPFGERVMSAREAVDLREVPPRLLVIGGGVIGLELGTVFQKLGSNLTVVEATGSLLPGVDPECTSVVERKISRRGGVILKNARVIASRVRESFVEVDVELEGGRRTIEAERVLVSAGMRPRSRGLGLEDVGVRLDERGFVTTDPTGRTNVPSIYAIGDVSGPPLLAHKAAKEGEVVAEVIAGHAAAKDWVGIPYAIFTDPEIASVGLTEALARERGIEVQSSKVPFSASGRAIAVDETEGFVKIVADRRSEQVIGVHIVGAGASDLIGEGTLALEMSAFLDDLALTVHPHPTLTESIGIAASHALGKAIDVLNREDRSSRGLVASTGA